MAVGFEAINNYGSVLIDANYKNLRLISKQSFTKAAGVGSVTISVPNCVTPIGAIIHNDNTGGAVTGARIDGTTFEFVIVASASLQVTGTAYIFDAAAPTTLGYGMQVFDANGACVFDSGDKMMRITDLEKHAYQSINGYPRFPEYSVTYPAGRTYAVCTNVEGILRYPVLGGQYGAYFVSRFTTNGNTIGFLENGTISGPPVTGSVYNPQIFRNAEYMILDVTDF